MRSEALPSVKIEGRHIRFEAHDALSLYTRKMTLSDLIALVAALPDEQKAAIRTAVGACAAHANESMRLDDELASERRAHEETKRRVAELPDAGEPGHVLGALVWERDFREETHAFRVVGVARLLSGPEEPIAVRIPESGIDAEEARWLAAALLAAARSSESPEDP
jgi:hypothetical protein